MSQRGFSVFHFTSGTLPFFYIMLTIDQARKDFDKLLTVPCGTVVTVGFGGRTAQALKSTSRDSVTINEYGETIGTFFTIRMRSDAFNTMPKEKDTLTIDGTEFQVAENSLSGFGGIYRAHILDKDV